MTNREKLVVLLPGFGYGPDKPLLYYAAKAARRHGLDCLTVNYTALFAHEKTPQASAAKSLPGALADAEAQIPAGYESYILVAKSFGTMAAAHWAKAHPDRNITLLQLTPLAWQYAPLYAGMPAWHVTGTADPLGGEALRASLLADPAIETYFVPGGNHSLDTPDDLTVGIEALKRIVRRYEQVMG